MMRFLLLTILSITVTISKPLLNFLGAVNYTNELLLELKLQSK